MSMVTLRLSAGPPRESLLMKLTPWYLAALSPFAVLGFSSAVVGQIAILLVVVGIFVGTLTLNRRNAETVARSGESSEQLPSTPAE